MREKVRIRKEGKSMLWDKDVSRLADKEEGKSICTYLCIKHLLKTVIRIPSNGSLTHLSDRSMAKPRKKSYERYMV